MSGDVITAVERALRRGAPSFRLVAAQAAPWWSATFAGHRVVVTIAAAGETAAGWLAALPEADLPMRGRFIADCVAAGRRREDGEERVELALLVIDEA